MKPTNNTESLLSVTTMAGEVTGLKMSTMSHARVNISVIIRFKTYCNIQNSNFYAVANLNTSPVVRIVGESSIIQGLRRLTKNNFFKDNRFCRLVY